MIATIETDPATAEASSAPNTVDNPLSSSCATSQSPAAPQSARRPRRGKIAILHKSIREQINTMLGDGLPYRAIIEKLQTLAEVLVLGAVAGIAVQGLVLRSVPEIGPKI